MMQSNYWISGNISTAVFLITSAIVAEPDGRSLQEGPIRRRKSRLDEESYLVMMRALDSQRAVRRERRSLVEKCSPEPNLGADV
jgi:hypothetical protein